MKVIHQGNLTPWEPASAKEVKLATKHMTAFKQWYRHPITGVDFEFGQIEIGNYVSVMPFTTTGNVVLLKEWKQGVERVCIGMPGGAIGDFGIEDAAAKILKRETGYHAGNFEVCAPRLNLLNSRCPNYCRLVIARDCQVGVRPPSAQAQVIGVVEVSQDELREMISQGELEEPITYVAFIFALLKGYLKL